MTASRQKQQWEEDWRANGLVLSSKLAKEALILVLDVHPLHYSSSLPFPSSLFLFFYTSFLFVSIIFRKFS